MHNAMQEMAEAQRLGIPMTISCDRSYNSWGGFIDSRRPTRFGRFRPYILGASVPLAIAAVLMFTKLPGLSPTQYLIFAYATYIFYGMMNKGLLRRDDPEMLAFAYTTPISALIHLCDREPEKTDDALAQIEKFSMHFIKTYGVQPK